MVETTDGRRIAVSEATARDLERAGMVRNILSTAQLARGVQCR